MHMALVILGGIGLLAIFSLFGKLWGADAAGIALAAKYFIPAWLLVSLTNMWVGVNKAGYTVAQELPILLVVFAVPAVLAAVVVWQMAKG